MPGDLREVGAGVLAGSYHFKETYGVPLIYMFDAAQRHGKRVCLVSYAWDGFMSGRKLDAVRAEIEEALSEKHGRMGWPDRIKQLFEIPIQEWPHRWPLSCPT